MPHRNIDLNPINKMLNATGFPRVETRTPRQNQLPSRVTTPQQIKRILPHLAATTILAATLACTTSNPTDFKATGQPASTRLGWLGLLV